MISNIYKELFNDTPIPYLHIKLSTNANGEYYSFVTIDYNKSYKNLFVSHESNDSLDFVEELLTTEEQEKWQYIFNKVKQEGKYTIERFIEKLKEYLSITIIYYKDEEFFLRLTKISNQHLKLSAALKNSPFPAWIKDRDGRYVDCNQSLLNTIDLKFADVIGKTNHDIIDECTSNHIQCYDEYVISNNKMYRYELKYEGKNKEVEYFDTVIWPYMDEDETLILGSIGVAINTSEAVMLRKKLQETEKRFLDIANNIDDIIIIQDEKKAEYINPAFERIYGFKPDVLYEDITRWFDYWDNVEFEEEPKRYNYPYKCISTFKASRKGQDDIWMWSKFIPIFDDSGNIVKKVGILTDITDSKKSQHEVDKMKMDFLANLSHELRTPINLIMSSLQVLYLKMYKLDPETYEYYDKYLQILSQNGQRLLKLVNNLIDTTKLDAGCFEHSPKNGDIISCVEGICQSITSFVNVNDLEIIFDTNEEEKIICFDADNMERILLNLLSNAIKFNKPQGKIEVTITCGDDIKISVKDTGIGIPKDKIDSVFGRFEQVKSKFKKEREGSGIGLSLVKSLVEMHGGNIKLKSNIDEGSEFIITLPDTRSDDDLDESRNSKYLNDVNMMKIELSDIYI